MNSSDPRQETVFGPRWSRIHGGYFADPAVAAPLVGQVLDVAARDRPDVLIDLGGGTGFLLSRLRAAGLPAGTNLLVLDDSPDQLALARAAGINGVQGSVDSFERSTVVPEGARGLFVMRSVLHYFGPAGLRPVLRHLRRQIRPGEWFVHQTASFQHRRDADCLNELYRLMRSPKWYPDVAFLREGLEAEGWRVADLAPVPPLPLTSQDLAERYHLTPGDLQRILERLPTDPAVPPSVFAKTPDAFCAHLHYHLFICHSGRGQTWG